MHRVMIRILRQVYLDQLYLSIRKAPGIPTIIRGLIFWRQLGQSSSLIWYCLCSGYPG